MATATRAARPTASPGSGKRLTLDDVQKTSKGLPSRMVLHGVEGWGKTSFAAQAPSPVFLMARGETGLETLMDQGLLGDIPHWPEIMTFEELFSALESLRDGEHQFETIVLDTINGFERLCHEMVCKRDFANDWTKSGFAHYQTGYDVAIADWRLLLSLMDSIREVRKMAIICLCHTSVQTFKNPTGADFDRYSPEMHKKTWGLTHKWADMVLFGNFETFVEEKGKKAGKGQGGQSRMIYTIRHAAYDAKNRHNLAEEIECGNSPSQAWANFQSAIKAGRGTK